MTTPEMLKDKQNLRNYLQKTIKVVVASIVNPLKFYLIPESLFLTSEEFAADIQREAEDQFHTHDIKEGNLYLVQSALDGQWHRGKTIKVNDETYKVKLIDSGLEEEIPKNKFKTIHSMLALILPRCWECSFYNVGPGCFPKFIPATIELFKKLVADKFVI